jgi:hypothetical protein
LSDYVCIEELCGFHLIFQPLSEDFEIFGQFFEAVTHKAVSIFESELSMVHDIFIRGCIQTLPPNSYLVNMSSFTQCILWSRGLLDRIQSPLRYMHRIRSPLLTCEAFISPLDTYARLSSALKRYEESLFKGWLAGTKRYLETDVLRQPLLRLSNLNLLQVNFEYRWHEIFQEGKLLEFQGDCVPEQLQAFCRHRDSVHLVFNLLQAAAKIYNAIFESIEDDAIWPLMIRRLGSLREMFTVASDCTWKSYGVLDFVQQCYSSVEINYGILLQIRCKVKGMLESLQLFGEQHLFKRNYQRALMLTELDEILSLHVKERYDLFTLSLRKKCDDLNSIMEMVGANSVMPEWIQYAVSTWTLIKTWLKSFVFRELEHLNGHLELKQIPSALETTYCPMIDVKLLLLDNKITFVPPIEGSEESIFNAAIGWMENILYLIFLAKQEAFGVDFAEVSSDYGILQMQTSITKKLQQLKSECFHFSSIFLSFDFLWNSNEKEICYDLNSAFLMTESKDFPDIEIFRKVMFKIEALNMTLSAISDVVEISWLRIDIRQIKASTFALLQEWGDSHMVFLVKFIQQRLDSITSFISVNRRMLKEASEQLSGNSILTPVLQIMKKIREEGIIIEDSMELLSEMIEFVDQIAHPKSDDLSLKFSDVMASWAELQKHTLQVKGACSTLISAETEKLRLKSESLDAFVANAISSLEQIKSLQIEENDDACVDRVTTEAYDRMLASKAAIDLAVLEFENMNWLESLLEIDLALPSTQVKHLLGDLILLKKMWDFISFVLFTFAEWNNLVWRFVDCRLCSNVTNEMMLSFQGIQVEMADNDMMALVQLEIRIRAVQNSIPSLLVLQSSEICARHWDSIIKVTTKSISLSEQITFKDVIEMNLHEVHEDILKISERAAREQQFEQEFLSMELRWSTWRLTLHANDLCQIPLLHADVFLKIIADLQEEQVLLQRLQSKDLTFLSKRIESWQRKFAALEIIISSLDEMQDLWVRISSYLLPNTVLCAEFPISTQSFKYTNEEFISLMQSLNSSAASLDLCSEIPFMQKIRALLRQLTNHQLALSGWLQTKRQAYSRFYFLCDKDLFSLLSKGIEPAKTYVYLLSNMFEGIQSLQFASRTTASGNEVQGIIGFRQEVFSFDSEMQFPVDMGMEIWCAQLNTQVVLNIDCKRKTYYIY